MLLSREWLAAALAAGALLAATPARAGGFANPEMGERRTGMGAVVGRPDDLSAVFHNPAGLALRPGTRLYVSLGAVFVGTDLRLRPWPGSGRFIDAPVDAQGYYPRVAPRQTAAPIPMLVAATSLWTDRLVGAVSAYVPNAGGAFFDRHAVTRYHLIDSYLVAAAGGLSLAWAARPWLAVGAGFDLVYVRLHGSRDLFPIIDGRDLSAFLGAQSSITLTGSALAPGWNLGVLVWPHPRLSLGAAVISRIDLDLAGDVVARTGADAPGQFELRGTQHTNQLLPWTLLAGANLDLTHHVEVGAELRWYFLRQLQVQHTAISGIGLIDALDQPMLLHDSWQVAGGVRVHGLARGWEWMAGGHYDRTPAPSSTVNLESPFFSHAGFFSGVRWQASARYRLALTWAHYWYLARATEDSRTVPPTNFAGSGHNDIVTLTLEAALGRGLVRRR
ncbi:MAG TPA: outer membrane protein transport protein [Polyangia bacterium]|jgi:long-subunit fatty acid transport protein